MSDEREMIVLDPTLAEHLGQEHWRGEAWCYADELPPQALKRYKPLTFEVFARQMSLLGEHHGKTELSAPLIEKYFEILSQKLNKDRFLQAVEAAYSADLYWNQVINFLTTYHETQQVAGAQAYALVDDSTAKNLLTGLGLKPNKA